MQIKKYSRRGVTRVVWLPTVKDPGHVPTRAELTAGTDLSAAIAAIDGWSISNQAIETPDLSSTFETKIPGTDSADDSSLTFYEDETADEVEQLLSKGAVGWVAILRKGDVPGSRSMDVFPVRVGSRSPQYSVDNEAAKHVVSFSITEAPVQDAAVPALAPKP
ncbi:hypothetical protein ACN20G_33415 (plasmid) [Streptomyces sp. BI20]|uniref:phage tail tube protein n=1 Tax=Streptomyces sp. BI20 TaxID=3403460 RepID=UPI003C77EAFD